MCSLCWNFDSQSIKLWWKAEDLSVRVIDVLLSGDVRSNFVPARDMQSMSLADLDRNIHLC